jgi:hypothetical protein
MRRAILHIGTVKTGSTALQLWLSNNRKALAQHDYHYSRAAGGANHAALAAYAQDDRTRDDIRANLGIKSAEDLKSFRARLAADLASEVRDGGDRTFVFSSEFLHARLLSVPEIRMLHALLAPHFDEVSPVVYLRRQDKVLVSGYTTMLANGSAEAEIIANRLLDGASTKDLQLDYFATLGRWAEVFGADSLSIRLYDDMLRDSGSVVRDFCSHLGFEPEIRGRDAINVSLRPEYQEFLRLLNGAFVTLKDRMPGARRGDIVRVLKQHGSGPGRLPSRARAEAYYARFRDSNEALRQRWFPHRATLFDESFDDYPLESPVPALDEEALLTMVAELWSTAAEERVNLLRQISKSRREIARLQSLVDRSGAGD